MVKEPATAYLTKRALVRAVNKGTRNKAKRAMELMGYVMKVEDGWIIKEDEKGNKTRIAPVDATPNAKDIIVD